MTDIKPASSQVLHLSLSNATVASLESVISGFPSPWLIRLAKRRRMASPKAFGYTLGYGDRVKGHMIGI